MDRPATHISVTRAPSRRPLRHDANVGTTYAWHLHEIANCRPVRSGYRAMRRTRRLPATLYNLLRSGDIPSSRYAGRRVVWRPTSDRFLQNGPAVPHEMDSQAVVVASANESAAISYRSPTRCLAGSGPRARNRATTGTTTTPSSPTLACLPRRGGYALGARRSVGDSEHPARYGASAARAACRGGYRVVEVTFLSGPCAPCVCPMCGRAVSSTAGPSGRGPHPHPAGT